VSAHLKQIWSEDRGVLTFEWILLITLIVIGIVGGLSAVRDAVIDELGDVAGAVVHVDQSYTVTADGCLEVGNAFGFEDELPECSEDEDRQRSTDCATQEVRGCDQ
jgi:Flp pilus assembly pilin Flp